MLVPRMALTWYMDGLSHEAVTARLEENFPGGQWRKFLTEVHVGDRKVWLRLPESIVIEMRID